MKIFLIISLLSFQVVNAQSNELSQLIREIGIEEDTVKSVYDWVTTNIKYDVKKLNKIEKPKKRGRDKNNKNGKSLQEHKAELLEKVIKKKKGVCEDYSLLFDSIIKSLGYRSFIVEGYTKNDKGKIARKVGHTWNAVFTKGEWSLYDPTWGAGYVKEGKKFYWKYNDRWYDVDPSEMIKTHMPYDPIWQLSRSPITYESFEESTMDSSSVNLDFTALINEDLNSVKIVQLQKRLDRSILMGEGVNLIIKWRKLLGKRIEAQGRRGNQEIMTEAFEKSNRAIDHYNDFNEAIKKKFKGDKWSLENAEMSLIKAKQESQSSLEMYQSIEEADRKTKSYIKKAIRRSEKLLSKIDQNLLKLKEMKG